jgi:hypothetical protein
LAGVQNKTPAAKRTVRRAWLIIATSPATVSRTVLGLGRVVCYQQKARPFFIDNKYYMSAWYKSQYVLQVSIDNKA